MEWNERVKEKLKEGDQVRVRVEKERRKRTSERKIRTKKLSVRNVLV